MVSENVAYQLQNFEEAEIDESPVKWCSVTLSDIKFSYISGSAFRVSIWFH